MADTDLARLTTFQHHIDDMRNLVMCKICLKPLYEPFMISCGHTYCYGCLRSWFCGLDSRRRKKNCPDCRAEVRLVPSPNYILRDLVHMFIGRTELLPEDETVDEHLAGKIAEADLLATDKEGPGIFQGIFGRSMHPFGDFGPLRDEADGVLRCPHCFYEMEDGMCNHCGYEMDDDDDYPFSDGDDDESISHDGQSIASDDISNGSGYDSDGLMRHLYAAGSLAGNIDQVNGTDGYSSLDYDTPDPYAYGDEEDEMDGFIDDHDEDEPDEVDEDGMDAPAFRYGARWRSRPYRIPDDEDDSQGDADEESDGPIDSWHQGATTESSDASDDEADSQGQQTNYDESEESRSATPVAMPIVPRRRPILISDDEEEEEDDENVNDVDIESRTEGFSQGDDTGTEGNDGSDSDDTTIPPQSSTFRRQRLDDHRKRRRVPDTWRTVARARRDDFGERQERQPVAASARGIRPGNPRRIY